MVFEAFKMFGELHYNYRRVFELENHQYMIERCDGEGKITYDRLSKEKFAEYVDNIQQKMDFCG